MIEKLVYGLPDFFVQRFEARDRRAFGFWVLVVAAIGAPFFGRLTMYVTILSVIALVPNYTSETPVEYEDSDGDGR